MSALGKENCPGGEEGSGWRRSLNGNNHCSAVSAAGNSALSCDLFYIPTKSEKGRQNETEGMRMLMRVPMM